MSQFVEKHFLPALIGTVLAIVVVNSYPAWRNLYVSLEPAITWGGVEVLTPVVRPGETLKVVYRVKVNRQCPAELQRFIMTPDGAAPVRFDPLPGGYTHASPDWNTVPVSFTVPLHPDPGQPDWKSGEYLYRSVATRYCPEGTEIDDKAPDVKFKLEVP